MGSIGYVAPDHARALIEVGGYIVKGIQDSRILYDKDGAYQGVMRVSEVQALRHAHIISLIDRGQRYVHIEVARAEWARIDAALAADPTFRLQPVQQDGSKRSYVLDDSPVEVRQFIEECIQEEPYAVKPTPYSHRHQAKVSITNLYALYRMWNEKYQHNRYLTKRQFVRGLVQELYEKRHCEKGWYFVGLWVTPFAQELIGDVNE